MTDLIINDYVLHTLANDYAQEILEQTQDIDDAQDLAHEYADGSEWVIYYYKAHMLCQNCDIADGQYFVDDCWGDTPMSYDDMATRLAYGELHSRITTALYKLFDA